MPLAKSMPSPKTSLPTSRSTCEYNQNSPYTCPQVVCILRWRVVDKNKLPLLNLFLVFIGPVDMLWFGWAGPYCTDTRTKTCHWAPGLLAWKLNTSTTVPCAVAPLQVCNFNTVHLDRSMCLDGLVCGPNEKNNANVPHLPRFFLCRGCDRLWMEGAGRESMRGIIRLVLQWNMQVRGEDESGA